MRDGLDDFAELLNEPADDVEGHGARPERRRRRRRGWIAAGVAALVIVALVGGYTVWALSTPIALPVASTRVPAVDVPAAAELELPWSGGWAVSVAGGEEFLPAEASGIWHSTDLDEPRPMASITKLVTALVVLDARPLEDADDPGPTLTFHGVQKLYDKYYVQNATVARMRPGSTMSQRDVLQMMLIVSASNYAEAAAVWAHGSLWSFAEATEKWLERHGLDDTRVVEPSGIDPRNTSTPRDLMALAEIAMAEPAIAEIVGQRSLDVPGFTGSNTNTLVGGDAVPGVSFVGVKTGTLDESGANLLFTARVGIGRDRPLTVTGVLLGTGSQTYNASTAEALLASLSAGFHDVDVAREGTSVGDYATAWGASAEMLMASDATVFTWSDTPIEVDMVTRPLSTGRAGEVVGSLTWTAGTETATTDLVLSDDIALPDAWWRLTHPFELLD